MSPVPRCLCQWFCSHEVAAPSLPPSLVILRAARPPHPFFGRLRTFTVALAMLFRIVQNRGRGRCREPLATHQPMENAQPHPRGQRACRPPSRLDHSPRPFPVTCPPSPSQSFFVSRFPASVSSGHGLGLGFIVLLLRPMPPHSSFSSSSSLEQYPRECASPQIDVLFRPQP